MGEYFVVPALGEDVEDIFTLSLTLPLALALVG